MSRRAIPVNSVGPMTGVAEGRTLERVRPPSILPHHTALPNRADGTRRGLR
jgi:hypothetical protein